MSFDILSFASLFFREDSFYSLSSAISSGYLLIIYILCLAALVLGSLTDFKKREVLDYLSYFLIFASLGIRLFYSIYFSDYSILLSGIFGFLLFFALSVVLYYSGQWGGGDSKVLMGLGTAIGIYISPQFSLQFRQMLGAIFADFNIHTLLQDLLQLSLQILSLRGIFRYLFFVLIVGAVYAVVWSIILAVVNRKSLIAEVADNLKSPFIFLYSLFAKQKNLSDKRFEKIYFVYRTKIILDGNKFLEEKEKIPLRSQFFPKLLLFFISVAFLGYLLSFINPLFFALSNVVVLFVILIVLLKSVETVSLVRTVDISQITEGEWISQDHLLKKSRPESLEDFLRKKIMNNTGLSVPVRLKDDTVQKKKSGQDNSLLENEIAHELASTKIEISGMVYSYSAKPIVMLFRKMRLNFWKLFRHEKYLFLMGEFEGLFAAKDIKAFNKAKEIIVGYNPEFSIEALKALFSFDYDYEYVCGPSQLGLELEGIEILKKSNMKQIEIRLGIPFVPSFLFAFIFFVLLSSSLNLFFVALIVSVFSGVIIKLYSVKFFDGNY